MLKVLPIQSEKERQALCSRFHCIFDSKDFAYVILIDEKEYGIVTFSIKGKKGILNEMATNPEMASDFEAEFIAGRVAMNFMDKVGAVNGYFKNPKPEQERLVKALGYQKQEDGSYYLNTEGFFTNHCKNHRE